MARDRAPSSQFYWRDWIVDTRGMSRDERGGYIDVLAFTHQTPTPGVMTEDQVRRWAGYTEEEWPAHRQVFSERFQVRDDGTWLQRRAIRERKAQIERREIATRGANATNAMRWGRRSNVAESSLEGRSTVADASLKRRSTRRSTVSPASALKEESKNYSVPNSDSDTRVGPPEAGTAGDISRQGTPEPDRSSAAPSGTGPTPIGQVLAGIMSGIPTSRGTLTGADVSTEQGAAQERDEQLRRLRGRPA
jgi:uncharacterized protein YdaU (DUF1376 family)